MEKFMHIKCRASGLQPDVVVRFIMTNYLLGDPKILRFLFLLGYCSHY